MRYFAKKQSHPVARDMINFPGSSGFTLIELLVVISIISLLVSILLPSLAKAKELAQQSVCMSKMRTCSVGMAFYAQDNNEVLPLYFSGTWNGVAGRLYRWSTFMGTGGADYVAKEAMICPSQWPCKLSESTLPESYVYGATSLANMNMPGYFRPEGGDSLSLFINISEASASASPVLADSVKIYNTATNTMVQSYVISWYTATLYGPGMVHLRHVDDKGNIVFLDGHVESRDVDHVIDMGFRGAVYGDGSLETSW